MELAKDGIQNFKIALNEEKDETMIFFFQFL